MTQELLKAKLESLGRCIQRINSKKPFSVDDLKSNIDLQDVLVLNLERAVQVCVDLAAIGVSMSGLSTPATMAESFAALRDIHWIDAKLCIRMQKAVGFRNLAVHEYEKINWEIVFKIIEHHLIDFQKFGAAISKKTE